MIEILNRTRKIIGPKSWARYRRVFWLICLSAIVETASVAAILPFIRIAGSGGELSLPGNISVGLTQLVILVIGLYLVGISLRALSMFHIAKVNLQEGYLFGSTLFSSYLEQNYEWHLSRHSSDIAATVLKDAQDFISFVLIPIGKLIGQIALVTLVALVLLIMQPLPTLVFGSILVVAYGAIFLLLKSGLAKNGRIQIASHNQRQRNCSEALLGIRETKLSKLEARFSTEFFEASDRLATAGSHIAIQTELPKLALEAFIFIFLILFISIPSGSQVGGASQTLPNIALFAVAGLKLFPMGHLIFRNLATLQSGLPLVNKFEKILGEFAPPIKPAAAPRLKSQLRLRNLTYRYPSAPSICIKDTNLTIKLGERLAIVGPSGAGKSTLIDLISGLIQPDSGTVEVDGITLDATTAHSWQDRLRFCPQKPFLFDLGVAENIALESQYDVEKVLIAAGLSGIEAYVKTQMQPGAKVPSGELARRLSGGQLQRVSIARTLYKDAPIYIFDEPTSNLDQKLAREIFERIFAAKPDSAILVVTHDLAIAASCDRIIELVGQETD